MRRVQKLIKNLSLKPHPEGGYYKEIFRDAHKVRSDNFTSLRHASTAIYYLLNENNFSAFHRIKSAEGWHYYQGTSALNIYEIKHNGTLKVHVLSHDFEKGSPYTCIEAGSWFAACLSNQDTKAYALVGCTVAPAFDFRDFEIGVQEKLIQSYPEHTEVIQKLCSRRLPINI